MRRLALACVLLAGTAFTSRAAAQPSFPIPANEGWVTDQAKMLDPGQERALETLMESYRQGTTHEIALLTIERLPANATIESLALAVAREWKLGGKDEHNAALLVVSKTDRKLRIEVGRGLEGQLTDSISGRIIRDVITPQFRQQRFATGLRAGIQAIHAAIGGDYAAIPDYRSPSDRRGSGAGCWLLGFVFLFFLLPLLARARSRAGSSAGRRGSVWPWLLAGALAGRASSASGRGGSGGGGGGGFGGGGFGGFGGGGGFSGGGASGGW